MKPAPQTQHFHSTAPALDLEGDRAEDVDAALLAGPVIFQTDTVYCVAALPRPELISAVHALKGRPLRDPEPGERDPHLPIVVGDARQLPDLGLDATPLALSFAAAFWPGPLTMVLGFSDVDRRPAWLAGRREAAVRIPDFGPLLAVLGRHGPLVMTSANLSGAPAAQTHDEACRAFRSPVPVFSWRPDRSTGVHSTILNVREDPPTVERPGAVSLSALLGVYARR